ncbi:uncharacterized protein LOC133888924 [Phragmites australis]|uniref:uncharacterized protein LOC133888924 n=1 Tax=Phragmites australis TaxID=29695 RepID=UPI002D77A927|nr:uncharacterized protein LOC133888924 [Phragmites australis]
MGTKVYACAYLLALVGVVLALAGPVAGYGFKATFAASGPGSWSGDAAALRRLMSTRLEDGVAPELTVDLDLHRRVLAGNSIGTGALESSRQVCLGSCAAPGEPYTDRGCQKKYRCRGD